MADSVAAAAVAAPPATIDAIQPLDMFGGDSDLSDLSDSEDEADAAPSTLLKRPTQYASSSASSSSDEEGDEEDDLVRGGDGEYEAVDEGASSSKKKGKKAKTSSGKAKKGEEEGKGGEKKRAYRVPKKAKRSGEEDLDEDGEPRQRKKPKTKKSSKIEDLSDDERQLSPDATRRKNLKDRIDEIIKKPKSKTAGGKKKRGDNDDLGQMNDEVVIDLRKRMIDAALADTKANDEGRPAVEKVKLLSEVVEMMQKTSMAESLIENGILDAVTKWLEPLGDKSLPALIIQRSLFDMLLNINIETFSLKASGLGKIVYFYTKVKGVDAPIARHANQLVINWMRPIIGRSKDFFDRDSSQRHPTSHSNSERLVKSKLGENAQGESVIARRHARVPDAMTETFSVSPAMDIGAARARDGGGMGRSEGNSGTSAKMKEYKKKLIAGQAASRRV